MSERARATANRFAAALDAEDYAGARSLLDEDCRYDTGTGVVAGAEAILASYRANGEQGRSRFEAIEYTSHVTPSGSSSATIEFTDRVRLGGEWHTYRCRQHVRLDDTGLVAEIVHEELPGERERLLEFEQRRSENEV